MPDVYLEDLTGGVSEQPTDTYFFQRLINGVWTEYKVTAEQLYGMALGVVSINVNQANFTAGEYTVPFTTPAGKSVVALTAYGTCTRDIPQTGVLPEALRVTSESGGIHWIGANIADNTTEYGVLLTQEGGSDPLGKTGQGFKVVATPAWMATDFTLNLYIHYFIFDILPPA